MMGTAKMNTTSSTSEYSTNMGQSRVKTDAKTAQTRVARWL